MDIATAAVKKLGARIRKIRESRNITQQELAAELDVEQAYISNIERGIRSPSFRRLVYLANALGVKVAKLCDDI